MMRYLTIIATIVTLSGLFATQVLAQTADGSLEDIDQRIAQLESSVTQLKRWRLSELAANRTCPSISAGYSFLFTKLHYKESFEATINDLGTGTLNLIPFSNNHELTPRVWFGYQSSSGLGVRGTYWNFDHDSDPLALVSNGVSIPSATSTSVIFPASIVAPFPGDQLSVDHSLNATTVDLEGTYDVRVRRLEATLGAGLRYAHFDQRFDAVVVPGNIPGAAPAALRWMREFEGLGPMMSAFGRLPFGQCGLYGTGGASVSFLFGDKNLNRTVLNDATPVPNRGLPILVFDDSDEITGVYGTSIGMGWQRSTSFGRCWLEGTYESQLWTEGGAPTITFAGFNGFSATLGIAR